ncbi:uncharacterized protein [Miscanthus floridulus]|uniref:uncharacterized protein isoform X2 n=1 Tax=Miscanthus floridulus TaxID=154761 RepID=UPI00345B04F8
MKRQARPQRPDPRAQLARPVGPVREVVLVDSDSDDDVNPAAMRLELETSGKVATGAAPTAAKKKVPVPGAKRDKRAASTTNKKAPVTIDKRAKGLASTSKKMVIGVKEGEDVVCTLDVGKGPWWRERRLLL